MQVTVVPEQLEAPMTVIGEQSRPTRTSTPFRMMPRSPNWLAMAGSLDCRDTGRVSHRRHVEDDDEESYFAEGAAARGSAGGFATAALDRSGDRKKGQSRENESAGEDHGDMGDEWKGECECSCL